RPLVLWILGAALLLALAAFLVTRPPPAPPALTARIDASYERDIQPLFDRRCVVCHACYDAPCQANLQSFEGLDRGANTHPVYQPSRVEAMRPTRMFQDARTTEEWRAKFGFFPVAVGGDAAEQQSILFRMIEARRASPGGGPFDV